MKGTFMVKLVPGNFHIGFHHFGNEGTDAANATHYPLMDHVVKRLTFGDPKDKNVYFIMKDFSVNTL